MARLPDTEPPTWRVILRRARGRRYVKEWPARSRYAAKQLRDYYENEYDSGYFVEVRDPAGNVLESED